MGKEVGRIMQDAGEGVGRTCAKRWAEHRQRGGQDMCARTWERLGLGHYVGEDMGRTQAWVRVWAGHRHGQGVWEVSKDAGVQVGRMVGKMLVWVRR